MNNKQLLSMSILVIEDHKDTRDYLVDILQIYFKKVLFAVDGCDGLEKIQHFTPDVIVTDIKMPCLNGIDLIKKIKNDNYHPIIIFSTAFSNKEYLLEALSLKVDAYLIKPINVDSLLKKIIENLDNSPIISLKHKQLSSREYEVFLDLSKGLKPSKIALKYNIKAKTVGTYRKRIFEKMLFKSNAELVAYAIKNNLV